MEDPDRDLPGRSAEGISAPPPARGAKRSRLRSPDLAHEPARLSGPTAAEMSAAAAGGSGQPAAAEAHDPVPGLNIFADPDADALAAVLGRGFGAADWPHVWTLRAVSRGCHAAVCSDEVWRQLFEKLRAGKVHTPPAIRSLLQLGRHTRAEQLRRRPDLRIGVYFEAFMIGIREPSRAVAEVEDLDGLEFHVRLKEAACRPLERLLKLCAWWRGEPARRNRFGAGTMAVLAHDAGTWQELHTCPWEFVPAPPGCEGQHVRTRHPNGNYHLWKVRRHENWGWLLVGMGGFKSSFGFPGRFEAPDGVIAPEQTELSEAEAMAMYDAARAMVTK